MTALYKFSNPITSAGNYTFSNPIFSGQILDNLGGIEENSETGSPTLLNAVIITGEVVFSESGGGSAIVPIVIQAAGGIESYVDFGAPFVGPQIIESAGGIESLAEFGSPIFEVVTLSSTITAQKIIDEVEQRLFDDTNVRFSQIELLDFLNNAMRNIAMIKVTAYVKNISVQLRAGVKQTIPGDGLQLFEATFNMGADGSTRGRPIRRVNMQDIKEANIDWAAAAVNGSVVEYAQADGDLKNFYISPPQPSAPNYIEIVYGAVPESVAYTQAITMDDIYKEPIMLDMFRQAYSKEAKTQDWPKAQNYQQMFLTALGLKTAAEASATP